MQRSSDLCPGEQASTTPTSGPPQERERAHSNCDLSGLPENLASIWMQAHAA